MKQSPRFTYVFSVVSLAVWGLMMIGCETDTIDPTGGGQDLVPTVMLTPRPDTIVGLNDVVNLYAMRADPVDESDPISEVYWKLPGSQQWETANEDMSYNFQAPNKVGAYTCSLKVYTESGRLGLASVIVTVNSMPPMVEARADTIVGLSDQVRLYARAQDLNEDGTIESWAWKFGGSWNWYTTSSAETTITAPDMASALICSVRATDDDGEVGYSACIISVTSMPPVIRALGPDTAVGPGERVTLRAVVVSDNGKEVKDNSGFRVEWKLDKNGTYSSGGFDQSYTAPATSGNYVCSLRVYDDDDEVAYSAVTVKVLGKEPLVDAGKDTIVSVNDKVLLRGKAKDDDGSIAEWAWKFGDGWDWNVTAGPETLFTAPGEPATLICSLRVKDDDGLYGYDGLIVTVSADTPEVTITPSLLEVEPEGEINLKANIEEDEIIKKIEWKIGDELWRSFTPDTTGFMPTDTTFNAPAVDAETTLVCSLRVTDDDMQIGQAGVVIAVIPAVAPPAVIWLNNHNEDIQVVYTNSPCTLMVHGENLHNLDSVFWKIDLYPIWVYAGKDIDTIFNAPDRNTMMICSVKVVIDGVANYALQNFNVKIDPAPVAEIAIDSPIVKKDGSVYLVNINDQVRLVAQPWDEMGDSIVEYAWKYSTKYNAPWRPGSETTRMVLAAQVDGTYKDTVCSLRVKDEHDRYGYASIKMRINAANPVIYNVHPLDTVVPNDFTGKITITAVAQDINADGRIEKFYVKPSNELGIFPPTWQEQTITPASMVSLSYEGEPKMTTANNQIWVCSLKVVDNDGQEAFAAVRTASFEPYDRDGGSLLFIYSKDKTDQLGTNDQGNTAEPLHDVTFTYDFKMDKFEMRQGVYDSVMRTAYPQYSRPPWNHGRNGNSPNDYPVYNVSWYDAILFCNALSKREGKDTVYTWTAITGGIPGNDVRLAGVQTHFDRIGYRLPTEAEWEFACRAGTNGDFHWGNNTNNGYVDNYAHYGPETPDRTIQVWQKTANPWGLEQMTGNVKEWVNDYWSSDYDYLGSTDVTDPTGPQSGSRRVVRGGGWRDGNVNSLKSGWRERAQPDDRSNDWGFRIVIEVPNQ